MQRLFKYSIRVLATLVFPVVVGVGNAHAAVAVNKSFEPISVPMYGASRLTLTLLNTSGNPATSANLTDSLPSGMVLAVPPNISNSCEGSVTPAPDGTGFVLAGGSIPAAGTGGPGSCEIGIDVTARAAGSLNNRIPPGGLNTSEGSSTELAEATLTATTLSPVTGSKTFAPTALHGGATGTLTITLNNPNAVPLTNVSFTDNFPATLLLASPANLSTTCVSGSAASPASNQLTLSGGAIPASGSCTVTASVTPAAITTYTNGGATNTVPAGNLTSAQNVTNMAVSGTVTIQKGARILKAFAKSPVVHGEHSSFTITVQNYNATELSPVTFTDPMPTGITPTGIATAGCGTGTATFSAGSVSLTGGSVAGAPTASGASSCTITVNYTASNTGPNPNQVLAVTRTNTVPAGNASGVQWAAASASVVINPPPGNITVSKSFSGAPFAQGGTANLTITLTNTSPSDATITSFSDLLTTMGAGYTVGGAATTNCAGTGATNAPIGGTSIALGGGNKIPANGSCTINVPVAIAATADTGTRTNTVASGGLRTSVGLNGAAVSASISVANGLSISKRFTPNTVISGLQTSNLTITLTRFAGAPRLTDIVLTDSLPTAPYPVLVAAVPNASTTCPGGQVIAAPGAQSIQLTGATLDVPAAGAATASSCTVTVAVSVPATASGVATNTIAANTVTNRPGVRHAAASATLTAKRAAPSLAKGFSPSTGGLGSTAVLTIRILNNNADSVTLTGVNLTDTLPTGMVVASTPGTGFTGAGCTGAAPSATAGGSTVTLSNATVNAGATCVIKVNVRSNAAGNVVNTLPAGALTSLQGATNLGPTSATLVATGKADLYVTKQRTSPAPIVAGNSVTYSVVVGNKGPDAVAGATFVDAKPANAGSMAWQCAGTACPAASGSDSINMALTLAKDETVTYTVTVDVPAGAVGKLDNTATIKAPSTVVDPTPANNSQTVSDAIANVASLSISKATNTTTYTPGGTGQYTIVVGNSGPSNATGVSVADTLPAGVSLSGAVTCVAEGTANCGAVTGASGGTNAGTTGASINAGAGNTLTFSVPVTFASSMTANPLVNTASATPGGGTPVTNSASNTLAAKADLAVTKKATQPTNGTYLPGAPLNYSLEVRNAGPSDAFGVTVTDAVPPSVTVTNWSCAANGTGASCGTTISGTTNSINLPNVSLPAGAANSIAITVTGTANISATGDITNTVTAAPPAGVACTAGTTAAACTKTATVTNTNAGTPQLSVSKTATPGTFAVGATGSYGITVSNIGTSATTDAITVSDPLPTGITATVPATSWGTGWDCNTSTTTAVTCTRSDALLPGASAPVINVPVTIAANAASPSINTARVSGGGDSTCPPTGATLTRCQGSVSTAVNAPSITVKKVIGGNGTLVVNVPTSYIITATNNGQAATLAGTITDTIPTGLVIGTLPNGCTASGQLLTCDIPAGLATGSSVSYTIPVTPQDSVNGQSVINTATANGAGDPTCPVATRCKDTATGTVTAPQLKLEKSVTPTTLVVGQGGSYTLKVTNQGSATTTAVATVTDTIPAGLSIGTPPYGCSATGQTITCTIASLATGASTSFVIPVQARAALVGQSVTNAAGVTGGSDPGCPTGTATANLIERCKASVTAPVSAPQMSIVKTASPNWAVGVPASYTLEVTNTGSAASFGTITVTDVIPGSLTPGTLPGDCTATGQQVTCTSSAVLTKGAKISFVIPVTPTATSAPSVSNTATVQGGGDPVCPSAAASNCSSTVVTPVTAPKLQVTETANGPWTISMAGAAYTVTVTNVGPASTSDVVTVNATLPAGLSPGWSGTTVVNGWGCTATEQDIACTATPNLAANGTSSFTFPVNVLATAVPSVTTPVAVGGGGDPFNGGTTPAAGDTCTALDAIAAPNHCASVTLPIPTSGAVTTVKTLDAGTRTPLTAGQTVTYVLTATNSGGTAVSNYTLNEVVPAGATFTSITGGTTSCTAGAAAGTLCTVTIASVPAGGTASVRISFTLLNNLPTSLKDVVNVITEPAACVGAQCDAPPPPAGCTGSTCTPASVCTAGDPHCVSTPVTPPAGPAAIPTLSQWMLLMMAMVLALMGGRTFTRRRH